MPVSQDGKNLGPESPWRLSTEHLIRHGSRQKVSLKFQWFNNKAVLIIDRGDSLPWVIQKLIQLGRQWEEEMNEHFSFPLPASHPFPSVLRTYWEFSFLCSFIQYNLIPKCIFPHWSTSVIWETNKPMVEAYFWNLLCVTLGKSSYGWGN